MFDITAIVLAGGRSSRMGRNKALLPLNGVPVIERLIREMESVAGEVIIAGGGQPEAYRYLEKNVIGDLFPETGPMAGLHAGLTEAKTAWSLAVACDMPFAGQAVFAQLAERALKAEQDGWNGTEAGPGKRFEAVIPTVEGRRQPLLAAYRRSVLPGLENELREGNFKLTRWAEGLRAEIVDGAVLAGAAGVREEDLPFNMNRPEDYRRAQEWLEQ
ncbi:molybdenum cofactor guanylyltransferase [Paenibacillus sp. M1]|uniref:Probable molybdenum cofactor guanylyltransferase n=1 Tax=Paenibacillus haidiansis TaxID=1574488 RepID=A0ABU7VX05_9BACL